MSDPASRFSSVTPAPVFAASLALLVSVGSLACGDDASDTDGGDSALGGSELQTASSLLQQAVASGYRGWRRAPGWETPMLPSVKGVHGAKLDIFINETMAAAYDDQELLADDPASRTWPQDSVVVLAAYDDNNLLIRRALMQRAADDSWFFSEYATLDPTLAEPNEPLIYGYGEASCVDCHNQGSDFIISFRFPSSSDGGSAGVETVADTGQQGTEAGTTSDGGSESGMAGTGGTESGALR